MLDGAHSAVQVDAISVVQRAFDDAAMSYDAYAEVYRQISSRMMERLDLLATRPPVVVDIGCGTGHDIAVLRKRYPKSRILGLDLSSRMLNLVGRRAGRWRKSALLAADAHHLPLADASVDLLTANMLLPWCQRPHSVIGEMHRVLAPGGAVFFTTAGPDTLIEYRSMWQSIDRYTHGFGLYDMHDLGDSMLSWGFSAPVLDRENLTVSYPSIDAFETELRRVGAINLASDRRRGLISPKVRSRAEDIVNIPFNVTIELIQGHAWKSANAGAGQERDGEYHISVDNMRRSLSRS